MKMTPRFHSSRCRRLQFAPPALAMCAILLAGSTDAQSADGIFRGDFEPAPLNDTCETAATLSMGGAPMQGTVVDATPNYNSGLETCTGYAQAGPDVAYSVVLISGQQVTISLAPEAAYDASIALLGPGTPSVCNATPVTCLAGADNGASGTIETLAYTPATTGTYYIIVDSYYNYGGTFSIGVTSP